jgi:tRNA-Thr(GGU) m(6)t(6)A37 methyltransferase TsaA
LSQNARVQTPLECHPIGIVHSPLLERVDAPRQPGAGADVRGTIELFAGRHFEHALEDLSSWPFIWVLFWFHHNSDWRPKVLPPRSDRRRGVFATRSPHRPNPIGLSLLRLHEVRGLSLEVSGVDMLDGSPVLDIKPHVPYTDTASEQHGGWLEQSDPKDPYEVRFAPSAERALTYLAQHWNVDLRPRLNQTLALGPEPHPYRRIKQLPDGYRIAVKEWRARFVVEDRTILVTAIETGYRPRELADVSRSELEPHRAFVAEDFR